MEISGRHHRHEPKPVETLMEISTSSDDSSDNDTPLILNTNRIYIGESSSGKPHGQGTEFYKHGSELYEGFWKNGLKHGKGVKYFNNGRKEYIGNWIDNKLNGECIEYSYYMSNVILYQGNFDNGLYDEFGVLYNENGLKLYEGFFRKNMKDGFGKQFGKLCQLMYIGDWKCGKTIGNIASKIYKEDRLEIGCEGSGVAYYQNGARESLNCNFFKGFFTEFFTKGEFCKE